MRTRIIAIIYAIAAALFYAISVPFSKIFLENVPPVIMAGLLYLGAGLGVGIMYLFCYRNEEAEQRLSKKDLPYTVGMVILDVLAPILLMSGIRIGSSANASLLGNFEIVATTVIALLFFKEKVSRRLWGAILIVTMSSIILSFSGEGDFRFSWGSLLVIGATCCWGLENNCTRSISEKSTYQIVTIKGLCSGLFSIIMGLIIGENAPDIKTIMVILILGYVAYGLSIFTYIRAQKTLGASKTSVYYSLAPFIGVILSFVILKERVGISFIMALCLMIIGTVVIIYDTLIYSHQHIHTHVITHTHDGTTHTHIIEHCHEHMHVINDSKHGHNHTEKELENLLRMQH